jgi:hypothetical protein
VRRPERVISQSEEEGSGRRARLLVPPSRPFPVLLSLYRFGGPSLLLPQLATRFAGQVRPSKYTASTRAT